MFDSCGPAYGFYKNLCYLSDTVYFHVCSTGAVPEISKLTPEKAAALFVAGYNGDKFQPAYQAGPVSVDPVELGKELTALVRIISFESQMRLTGVSRQIIARKSVQQVKSC